VNRLVLTISLRFPLWARCPLIEPRVVLPRSGRLPRMQLKVVAPRAAGLLSVPSRSRDIQYHRDTRPFLSTLSPPGFVALRSPWRAWLALRAAVRTTVSTRRALLLTPPRWALFFSVANLRLLFIGIGLLFNSVTGNTFPGARVGPGYRGCTSSTRPSVAVGQPVGVKLRKRRASLQTRVETHSTDASWLANEDMIIFGTLTIRAIMLASPPQALTTRGVRPGEIPHVVRGGLRENPADPRSGSSGLSAALSIRLRRRFLQRTDGWLLRQNAKEPAGARVPLVGRSIHHTERARDDRANADSVCDAFPELAPRGAGTLVVIAHSPWRVRFTCLCPSESRVRCRSGVESALSRIKAFSVGTGLADFRGGRRPGEWIADGLCDCCFSSTRRSAMEKFMLRRGKHGPRRPDPGKRLPVLSGTDVEIPWPNVIHIVRPQDVLYHERVHKGVAGSPASAALTVLARGEP